MARLGHGRASLGLENAYQRGLHAMLDLGPVLALHGSSSGQWTLSVLIVTSIDPGVLHTDDGQEVEAEGLLSDGQRTAWRYSFTAELDDQPREITYTVFGASNTIHLPAKGSSPRIAYGSCNGFSSLKDMKRIADKNAMWKAMAAKHSKQPYNVLLLGGDQVYADSLWETVLSMREWSALGWDEANAAAFRDDMADDLKKFYFDLYVSRWKQPEISNMLAQVPMIAMWDDHDIFDGWGSYPGARQNCGVFQGLWPIARRAFTVFQQQLDVDRDEHLSDALAPRFGFTRGLVLGRVGVLALDMRSERTESRVLGPEHWNAVFDWMAKLSGREVDHLIVMSSIPVVYPGFDTIERILNRVYFGIRSFSTSGSSWVFSARRSARAMGFWLIWSWKPAALVSSRSRLAWQCW
jgi:hypothetical protein